MHWWHWLVVHLSEETGTSTSASRAYNFWSGFGSDLGEVVLIGAVLQVYRRHKCKSCPRPALRGEHGHVQGTHYYTCHKHTEGDHHDRLRRQHAVLHPEMHSHLNPGYRAAQLRGPDGRFARKA